MLLVRVPGRLPTCGNKPPSSVYAGTLFLRFSSRSEPVCFGPLSFIFGWRKTKPVSRSTTDEVRVGIKTMRHKAAIDRSLRQPTRKKSAARHLHSFSFWHLSNENLSKRHHHQRRCEGVCQALPSICQRYKAGLAWIFVYSIHFANVLFFISSYTHPGPHLLFWDSLPVACSDSAIHPPP